MLMRYLFLFNIVFLTSSVKADCWFDCDTISRNLSTDRAKVFEIVKNDHRKAKTTENTDFFCGENDKHEMHVISVEKDSGEELLVINISQFSPPAYGSSDWIRMGVDLGLPLRITKTLNFGLSNAVHLKSGDERCRASYISKTFFGSKLPGDTFTLVCLYSNDANLPISDDIVKKKSNIVSMHNCEE